MFAYPIAVDGATSRVLQSGFKGPSLILVHGLGSRADRWRRNLDPLAEAGWRVFAIDLPGHGFAVKGRSFDYSARGYARFLRGFVDQLREEKVALVGTSFGSLVVSTFAVEDPHRVRALVVAGAIGLMPMGEARRHKTIGWLSDMSRDGLRNRLRLGVVDKSLITDELVEEDFRINNSPGAAEAFTALARYYATTIDDDATCDPLSKLNAAYPTLLLWGEHDASVAPAIGAAAHSRLPGSRFVTVPGTGHLPYFEKPDLVNRMLIEFLN
ncbi:MAG TPA: alpha/beta fold hydrolase [Stellaceae bacterium]|nr:alpha/beta fold hydrolase [Stellaceae bacterium]